MHISTGCFSGLMFYKINIGDCFKASSAFPTLHTQTHTLAALETFQDQQSMLDVCLSCISTIEVPRFMLSVNHSHINTRVWTVNSTTLHIAPEPAANMKLIDLNP